MLASAVASSAQPPAKSSTVQSRAISSARGMYSEASATTVRTSASAEEDAGRRADQGDDQPLHEVVKGESPLRRAERDANGGFPCSRDGARQQQSGDVRAGDEQQHSRRNHQQEQRGLDFQKNRLPQIVEAGGVRRVRCGVERGNFGSHSLHVRLGLRERHAGLEPGVAEVHAHRSILAPAQRIESDPDLALDALDARSWHRQAEPWRRHAGDREGAAVERQRLADDAWIRSEPPPERTGDHRPLVVGEPLAHDGVDAEVPGERGRDRCAADVLRLARERQVEAARPEPAEHVEAPRALLILLKVRERVG